MIEQTQARLPADTAIFSSQRSRTGFRFGYVTAPLASGIVMEIHCHITGICEPPNVIILVQCNLFMIFQSIVIPVRYHSKSSKFVCNVIDLCTT